MSGQSRQDDRIHSNGIDFVYYPVTDLTVSVPFYRDTLGLSLESQSEDEGWAEFAVPPTTLAIDEAPFEQSTSGGAGVALAVDDVETATETLRNEGVTVRINPLETRVCEMAIIVDPDDNQIMLHRRNDGTHGRVDPFP